MQKQFALVNAGALHLSGGNPILVFDSETPEVEDHFPKSSKWIEVENQDERPFDIDRHYRVPPRNLFVRGDRVVRLYRVINKEDDGGAA